MLTVALITAAISPVIALTTPAFSTTEARIAGSDLHRTQPFYASSAVAVEKMTEFQIEEGSPI